MGVIHPLPKIGIFSKKYIIYHLPNIYTGFDVTRRFQHLIVASAHLAKCDEEEEVPPHHICYVPHPRNTRQWELPPYAHHLPASLET